MTDSSQPMVSIIIPAFNRAALVGETLDSIRRQTFADWETVVVDDGSADATLQLLEEQAAAEPRIRVLQRNRPPKGANTCRNIGLYAARGEYVIFLDSDDLLAPDCLRQRVAVVTENRSADFAVFQGLIFQKTPGDTAQVWNLPNNESNLCRVLRGDAVWAVMSPIWKKSAVMALGGFDENLTCWQDADLHLRALVQKLRYLSCFDLKPDYFYRRHDLPSISQRGYKSRENIASILNFCSKAADNLATSKDPEIRSGLRFLFARQVQLSLYNRHFDLALQGIEMAGRHHLIGLCEKCVWRLARACHRLRARGISGGARIGNHLMEQYLPKNPSD